MGKSGTYVTMAEFIQKAVQFEIESAEFYHDLRSRDLPEEAAEVLEALENQERAHAESLQGMNVSEGSTLTLQFGPTLGLSMPPAPSEPTLSALFDVAIEREEKSARIYEYASDFARGKFKELLLSLAEFEESHKRKLKLVMREYLS